MCWYRQSSSRWHLFRRERGTLLELLGRQPKDQRLFLEQAGRGLLTCCHVFGFASPADVENWIKTHLHIQFESPVGKSVDAHVKVRVDQKVLFHLLTTRNLQEVQSPPSLGKLATALSHFRSAAVPPKGPTRDQIVRPPFFHGKPFERPAPTSVQLNQTHEWKKDQLPRGRYSSSTSASSQRKQKKKKGGRGPSASSANAIPISNTFAPLATVATVAPKRRWRMISRRTQFATFRPRLGLVVSA